MYGDLSGKIVLDGHSALLVLDVPGALVNVPQGYKAVGLQLHAASAGHELKWRIRVLAMDCDNLDSDSSTAVSRYAKEHGEVNVISFPTSVEIGDIVGTLRHIKRLDITLAERCTEGVPLRIAMYE